GAGLGWSFFPAASRLVEGRGPARGGIGERSGQCEMAGAKGALGDAGLGSGDCDRHPAEGAGAEAGRSGSAGRPRHGLRVSRRGSEPGCGLWVRDRLPGAVTAGEAEFASGVVQSSGGLRADAPLRRRGARVGALPHDGARWRVEVRSAAAPRRGGAKKKARKAAVDRISDNPERLLKRIESGADVGPENYLEIAAPNCLPAMWE